MCLICAEFQQTQDLFQMRRQIHIARVEEMGIPAEHLEEIEAALLQEASYYGGDAHWGINAWSVD